MPQGSKRSSFWRLRQEARTRLCPNAFLLPSYFCVTLCCTCFLLHRSTKNDVYIYFCELCNEETTVEQFIVANMSDASQSLMLALHQTHRSTKSQRATVSATEVWHDTQNAKLAVIPKQQKKATKKQKDKSIGNINKVKIPNDSIDWWDSPKHSSHVTCLSTLCLYKKIENIECGACIDCEQILLVA